MAQENTRITKLNRKFIVKYSTNDSVTKKRRTNDPQAVYRELSGTPLYQSRIERVIN